MEKKDNVEKGVSGKPEKKKSAAYYEKRPEFGNRGPSKILLHFRKGITFFLVIAACVIFYFLLLRIEDISVGVSKVIDVLKPILYGMVIAYLLNPIVKQIDRWLIPQLKKKMSQEKAKKVSRSVGVFAALVMLLALILALCNMLIPELYKSIRDMVQTLPGQISDMVTKIISIQKDTSPAGVMARNLLEKGSDALQNWIKQDLLTKVNEVMSNLTVGIINFVSEILNFLIGLIVSVYILFSKETFSAQSKKIVYAVFRTDHANMILHLTKKSNEIFGGFIIGKIIDSMIIGVLCFFGLTLLKMPYILLISVIVGVTNVIPFFGPYIGAIPSAVLILLNDPIKGLYFLIFILVLQQLDGNVIGPKILGNSTGLSAFWVVFSILLGGGLFGFVGMIMGVPTFAVVYYIITMLINHLLEKKKLPLQTSEYGEKSYVDDSGRFVRENPEENDFLPHNYTRNCVCYTGTHDNDTTLGWYQKAYEASKDKLRRYFSTDASDICWVMIRACFSSVANMAVVPMQDVLKLDSWARLNTPGVGEGNWAWRFEDKDMDTKLEERLFETAKLYGR